MSAQLSTAPHNGLVRTIARFKTALYWALIAWAGIAIVLCIPWWVFIAVELAIIVVASVTPALRTDPPQSVAVPVRGEWAALNSPGTQIPSHGTRLYGQSHAIDILRANTNGEPVKFGWRDGFRAPEGFASFGEPVFAVRDGAVVRAAGSQRDHRSRSSIPALLYLMLVEQFRVLGGFAAVGGNHVVIDHGDGTFSAYAHLKRGSVAVRPGDRVGAGQKIGQVGNSGNSSEPHLHFQLMDRAMPTAAAGLDFRWDGVEIVPDQHDNHWPAEKVSTEITPGMPANGQVFWAEPR